MSQKVNPSPNLGRPVNLLSFEAIQSYVSTLVNSLYVELTSYSQRLNAAYINDGMEASLQLPSYPKASLPAAAVAAQVIYVTNDVGGAVLAFSDGTNWRRVTDRNIIS